MLLRRMTMVQTVRRWWVAGALTGLLLLVVLISQRGGTSAASYEWDFSAVTDNWTLLLTGLQMTAILTIACTVTGLSLGVVVALMRLSRFKLLRILGTAHVEIWRCTPVLIQLVWVYYALPVVAGVQLSAPVAAWVAFSLNVSAFAGEAYRAGIQSIPKEQIESAEILGIRGWNRLRLVILPQGIRNVLPVLVSIVVSLFKDTALVSTLGVADLLYNGQTISTLTYRPLEVLTSVALIYFAIAFPFTVLMRRLEVRTQRHLLATAGETGRNGGTRRLVDRTMLPTEGH